MPNGQCCVDSGFTFRVRSFIREGKSQWSFKIKSHGLADPIHASSLVRDGLATDLTRKSSLGDSSSHTAGRKSGLGSLLIEN